MYQLICIYIMRGRVGVEYSRGVILAEKIKHGAEDDASIINISQKPSSSLNSVLSYREVQVLLALLEGLQRCLVLKSGFKSNDMDETITGHTLDNRRRIALVFFGRRSRGIYFLGL